MRSLLLTLVLTAAGCIAGDDAPQMNTLSTHTAKPGDVIDIAGVGLDSTKIDEVYLTDHKFDMKVKLLEQKETLIRFRVPPFAKPGRVEILVLTKGNPAKGNDPKLLEQPLYIVIEDPATEVSQVKTPPIPAADKAPAHEAAKPESHEKEKDAVKQDQQ